MKPLSAFTRHVSRSRTFIAESTTASAAKTMRTVSVAPSATVTDGPCVGRYPMRSTLRS
jgi:hypothetical protein